MTTIITRLYKDKKTASGVVEALLDAGFPMDTVSSMAGGDADALTAARVDPATVAAVGAATSGGATAVVVTAPFTPFGAVFAARNIVDGAESIAIEGGREERYIKEEPKADLYLNQSILRNHPRFLSSDMNRRANANRGLLSHAMSWPLLTKHRTKRSARAGGGHILPFGTLKAKTKANSAISGGKRMMYNPF